MTIRPLLSFAQCKRDVAGEANPRQDREQAAALVRDIFARCARRHEDKVIAGAGEHRPHEVRQPSVGSHVSPVPLPAAALLLDSALLMLGCSAGEGAKRPRSSSRLLHLESSRPFAAWRAPESAIAARELTSDGMPANVCCRGSQRAPRRCQPLRGWVFCSKSAFFWKTGSARARKLRTEVLPPAPSAERL